MSNSSGKILRPGESTPSDPETSHGNGMTEKTKKHLLKKYCLQSFRNTTPKDLETVAKRDLTPAEAKKLGRVAVENYNWDLAEVAYKLCVGKPLHISHSVKDEGKLRTLSNPMARSSTAPSGMSRAKKQRDFQLSPIKQKNRGSIRRSQSRQSTRKRRSNSSSIKEMLKYEEKWQHRSAASFETAAKHKRLGTSRSRSSRTSQGSRASRRKGKKLFNFIDHVDPPPFMSKSTLARLSAPRKKMPPPPPSNILCEASGRWKGSQGGRFSNSRPKSDVEWIIYRSKQIPGPSHYRPKLVEPNKGIKFSDANPKSDVDWIIYNSKKTPGPAEYKLKSSLNLDGGVKFSDANPKTELEWIIYQPKAFQALPDTT